MKKQLAISLVAAIGLLAGCARTYTDKSANVEGQTFAVLPFDVQIVKNINVQRTTQAQLDQQAKSEAYRYQSSTYNYMLSKQKDFVIAFQDPDQTNTLLKRNKITYEKMHDLTKEELATLLKVDGVMWGKMYRKEVMPQAMAKGIDILASQNKLGIGPMTANDVTMNLSLFSKPEKRVVWTYQMNVPGGADESPESISASLMNNAARKFPYRKRR
ncbi:hypothetical protein [uncultured Fibrella sp.]|uniref:hypothetical protein n=1 Tax=uncultured Fibrella sp. TaxID=1284596 RepID=UPI0035C9D64A